MKRDRAQSGERGFALLLVFVLASVIAITLYSEMPRVAFESQRAKEQLLVDRGNEYKRGIQLYFRKFKRFPARIEDLESTNNLRFLRRRYTDPLTGKNEWRLVHVGPGGFLTDSLVQKPNPLGKDAKDQLASASPGNTADTAGQPPGPVLNANGTEGGGINLASARRPSDQMVVAGPIGNPNPNQLPPAPQYPGQPQYPQPQQYPPGVQPAYPGQPAQPAYPGQPGYPAQPGQPIYPGQPGYPAQPAQPGQPVYPGQPGYPAQPGQPIYPGQPGYPAQPTQPGQPVYPGQPGYPAQPVQPGQPVYPGQPGYPAQPVQPGQPVYPGQPGYPAQPVQPGQNPAFPPQPFNPNQPYPTQPYPGAQAPTPTFGLSPGTQQNAAISAIQASLFSPRQPPAGIGNTDNNAIGAGIAGVASTYKGEGIKRVNERSKYQEWEFVYDLKQDKTVVGNGAQQQNRAPQKSGDVPTQPTRP